MVALVLGTRLHAGQVRAGAGLGHRDRQDLVPGNTPGQPACLLLVGGKIVQIRADNAVMQSQEEPCIDVQQLLDEDLVVAVVLHACAAVSLIGPHA